MIVKLIIQLHFVTTYFSRMGTQSSTLNPTPSSSDTQTRSASSGWQGRGEGEGGWRVGGGVGGGGLLSSQLKIG